jgi:hypothetical protein
MNIQGIKKLLSQSEGLPCFIRGERVNTPRLGAVKKVLTPESNSLREQHTPRLAAGLLIS